MFEKNEFMRRSKEGNALVASIVYGRLYSRFFIIVSWSIR